MAVDGIRGRRRGKREDYRGEKLKTCYEVIDEAFRENRPMARRRRVRTETASEIMRHRQRDDTEPSAHIPTPLLGIRRAHPPVGLGAVGVDTISAARGSKRCRVTTVGLEEGNNGRGKISGARNDWCGFPKQSANTLGGQPRAGEEKGRARYGGVGEGREGGVEGVADGGGGCCTFLWPGSNNTSDRRGGQVKVISGDLAAATMLEREDVQDCGGAGSTLGLGGGCSAEHPSGMDVVAGRGGGHETSNGPAEDKNGWRAMAAIAGGSAVIASGFVAGGFPGHQWHQDQGGSIDDMLILYGSRS